MCEWVVVSGKLRNAIRTYGVAVKRTGTVVVDDLTQQEAFTIAKRWNRINFKTMVKALKRVNQCFKCKYGYSAISKSACPPEADEKMPCSTFTDEYGGLLYLNDALAIVGEE